MRAVATLPSMPAGIFAGISATLIALFLVQWRRLAPAATSALLRHLLEAFTSACIGYVFRARPLSPVFEQVGSAQVQAITTDTEAQAGCTSEQMMDTAAQAAAATTDASTQAGCAPAAVIDASAQAEATMDVAPSQKTFEDPVIARLQQTVVRQEASNRRSLVPCQTN